jgi:hypothetical protein
VVALALAARTPISHMIDKSYATLRDHNQLVHGACYTAVPWLTEAWPTPLRQRFRSPSRGP